MISELSLRAARDQLDGPAVRVGRLRRVYRAVNGWLAAFHPAIVLGLVVLAGLTLAMLLVRTSPALSTSISLTLVLGLIVAVVVRPQRRSGRGQ